MRAWIVVPLAWLCLAASARAEARLALVIGNDEYQHIDKLQKAKADAKAYAAVLREKGFSVREGYDLSIFDMSGAVADFVEKIHPGDTVVFVYSGHGWSDGAHNYLVGVDAPDRVNLERLTRLSLPLRNGVDGVLDDFQRKNAGLKVAIIDACRDDPFRPPPGERGYALARGLKPQSVDGSFVIYSAGEGQSAMDRLSDADSDPNSVFTRSFLPLLRADLPLHDAIKISQAKTHALAESAGYDQTPAYYDEVLNEACLSAACKTSTATTSAVPSPSPSAEPSSNEAVAAMIDAATNADFLAPLIARLADGPLKERAKARARALKQTQVANLPAEPDRQSDTTALNLTGVWRQPSDNSVSHITQSGNYFQSRNVGVFISGAWSGVGYEFLSEGTVTNNLISIAYTGIYRNGRSSSGHCTGIASSYRLIRWSCNDPIFKHFTFISVKN